MRPPASFSISAAKSLTNWCSGSLSAASDIFITIGCCACAWAAPNGSTEASANAAATAAIRGKASHPTNFIPPSQSDASKRGRAAFYCDLCRRSQTVETLDDSYRADNDNSATKAHERTRPLPIENGSDLCSKLIERERFGQEIHPGIEHAAVHDRVRRISGREQDFQVRTAAAR